MAIKQQYPALETPLVDPETGTMSLIWSTFFLSLWNRTGAALGNESAAFPYPVANGEPGQVLTSQGGTSSIWTTLKTKLSQFSNDVGYITSAALAGLQTEAQTKSLIQTSFLGSLAGTPPQPVGVASFAGQSAEASRADHVHAHELNPHHFSLTVDTDVITSGVTATNVVTAGVSATNVTASNINASNFVAVGPLTWTTGTGVPTATRPNGSLHSRSDGTTGARLYVSAGAGIWNPVPGV